MSPRTGRPKLDDDTKKNIRLEIRLNQEQDRLLNELAEKYQLTRTETIMKALELLAKKK